jgi:EAL domain-containing protein (putative c-di-GMP-specific phosphodiesterase class I)/GGDEF domain-containing protein
MGMSVLAFGMAAAALALALVAGVAAARLSARLAEERRRVARSADRLARLARQPAEGAPTLDGAVEAVEAMLSNVDRRLDNRHILTGLPTREPLLKLIEEDAEAVQAGGLLGTIAMLDFERLTAFDAGLAERTVVTLVERVLRMVAGRRMVAQVDRSRLAIWFGSDIAPEAARAELDAIGYALGGPIHDGDREILPEVRIGAARYPEDAATPQLLLTRAIAALSTDLGGEAKGEGIDPVAVARERYALEQDLRHAIARGQLELVFQPLIDAARTRVCGAEALLRWHHPERGTVPPSRFVPVMESAGLAEAIGLWTLNTAARTAHAWAAQGLEGCRVAVNVSGHQLHHAAFSMLVGRTLARHGLSPDALEVELTETVAAGDPERVGRIFEALRALGVRIAIDDFGTGFSSFSVLRQLRFDKIKIDREFVTAVDRRQDSQAICQSMIALGRGLGIRVLAEGVESRGEYEWLRAHGCDHFQGFYFSRPLTADALAAFAGDADTIARLVATDPRAQQRRIGERLRA